jgi:nitrogen fixation protein NifB
MAKVAVTSTDGISINEHFGKSQEFLIYEVQETGDFEFVERRYNDFHNASAAIGHQPVNAQLLADVEVVLTAQIGPGAEQELRNNGIIALTVKGSIEKALRTYGKRGKLLWNNIQGSIGRCQPLGSFGGCSCSGNKDRQVKT